MNRIVTISLKLQIILLCAIGFIVFSNIFSNNFILDDTEMIENNPAVMNHDIGKILFGGTFYRGDVINRSGQFFRPIMLLIFSLTDLVFGINLFVFHFWSILFHIINSILILFLFRRFLPSIWAFLFTLIFLVHPINTEAIDAISSLNDIIFATFGLAALLFAFNIKKNKNITGFLLVTTMLLLSLLSKETGVLFGFIIFISYFIFQNKHKILLTSSLSSLTIYILIRLLTVGLGFSEKGVSPMLRADLGTRLLTIPKIVIFYLKAAFFPIDLSRSHHWLVKNPNLADFFVPLIIIFVLFILVAIVWIRIRKKQEYKRFFLFSLLWFLSGLGLHSQIFPLEYTVGERWFYFSLIGLLGLLGITIVSFLNKVKKSYTGLFIAFAIFIIMILGIRTYIRNFDWKNNSTLIAHDIQVNTDSFELELFYGTELLNKKDYKQAMVHIKRSVNLNPYWLNINNLATAHLAIGDKEKALKLFKKSAYEYHYYKSFENLASIYFLDGKMSDAKKTLDDGLRLYPNDPKLWYISYLYWKNLNNVKQANIAAKKYLYLKRSLNL